MQSRTPYLVLAFFFLTACADDLQVNRTPSAGTFGEQVYAITCERVGYSEALDGHAPVDVSGDLYRGWCASSPAPAEAAPKVKALAARRVDIITAIDTALPHDYLQRLQNLLIAILPLYDDNTIQSANDKLGIAFQTMEQSPDFADAMSRLAGREGYRPLGSASLGLVRTVMEYPSIDQVLNETLRVIDAGGAGHDAWDKLYDASAHTLAATQPVANVDASDRTLKIALDLLMSQDAAFGTGNSTYVVSRDTRGLADVADMPAFKVDAMGQPVADGFGRLLLADGVTPAPAPFPVAGEIDTAVRRDAQNRALDASGNPLYVTLDVDKTFVAAAARQSRKLVDPTRDTAVGMLAGAKALMGAPMMRSKVLDDGTPYVWQGYDPATSPALDMVYGFAQLMGDTNFNATIDQLAGPSTCPSTPPATGALLSCYEPLAARAVGGMLDAVDRGKMHPEATIPANSTLYDDLYPIIQQIMAKPGLTEDLVKAMRDPATKKLGPIMAAYTKYKDRFDLNQQNQTVVGQFMTMVDRSQPDSGFNRSVNQRLFHLIADSAGARLCSKPGATITCLGITLQTFQNACDLLEIDDLAVLYVQSIARLRDANGNLTTTPKGVLPIKRQNLNALAAALTTDSTIQSCSGITGFTTHPTTEALNRALFLDPLPTFIADIQDPAVCNQGDRFIDAHNGTILAWECSAAGLCAENNADGFYEAIRPIIQAFADHDAENLFVDAIAVLHKHWPSAQSTDTQTQNPQGKYYVTGDGAVTYEPLLIEVFSGDLLPALSDASVHIDPNVLAAAGRYLFDPALSPGLHARDGSTMMTRNDGMPAGPPTPFLLLAEAYKNRRAALDQSGGAGDAWKRAGSNMVDDMLSVAGTGAQAHFANATFRKMLLVMADWLKARVAAHAMDRTTWTRTTLPGDAEDAIAGPVMTGLVELSSALESDDAARGQLYGLLGYLVDEAGSDPTFAASLPGVADVIQQLMDDPDLVPIVRTIGQIMQAQTGLVDSQVAFTHHARQADQAHALGDLVRQLFQQHQPGLTPVGVMVDAIAEVHRKDPGASGPMTADDYRAVYHEVADFIRDNGRGLARFTDIVKHRRLP